MTTLLGALVDVDDLGIEKGRVISQIERIGGYTVYKVQFNPRADEINPSVMSVHEHEMELIDGSEIRELNIPEFELGDQVFIKHPLSIQGIITGIHHSSSGCTEYEVDYKVDSGVVTHTMPAPLLTKTGTAAKMGDQTGSMNRSVERRQ